MMRRTIYYLYIILFALILFSSLWMYLDSSLPELIIIQATIILITPIIIFLHRYNIGGLGDPLILFSIFFAIYNSSILYQFGFNALSGEDIFFYGYRSIKEFTLSGFHITIAAFGLLLGTLIIRINNPSSLKNTLTKYYNIRFMNTLFWTGAVCLSATILFSIIIVVNTVGINEFLSSVRSGNERINISSDLGIGIPINAMELSAFAIMIISTYAQKNNKHLYILLYLMIVYSTFYLIQGSRHWVIYTLIAFLGGYATFSVIKKKQVAIVGALAVMVFIIFSYISYIRQFFPVIFRGDISISTMLDYSMDFNVNKMMPSNIEFAGPFFSLIETLNNNNTFEPQWGFTYISALLNILPTKLYPGVKSNGVASQFSAEIQQQTPSLDGIGFGFSPVAEAYLNFGSVGILLIFIVIAFFCHWVGSIRRSKSLLGPCMYLVLLPQVLNANRYSLDGVLQQAVYSIIVVTSLYIITLEFQKQ